MSHPFNYPSDNNSANRNFDDNDEDDYDDDEEEEGGEENVEPRLKVESEPAVLWRNYIDDLTRERKVRLQDAEVAGYKK